MKYLSSILVTFFFIYSTCAVVIDFEPCSDEDSKQCVINEVRVSYCSNPARCVYKRGEGVEFSFDFTPEFAMDTPKNKVFANINGEYVDWVGELEESACSAVQCPLTSNTKATYTRDIKLSKTTQAGKFRIKWKLLNEEETNSCCFELNVQVKK